MPARARGAAPQDLAQAGELRAEHLTPGSTPVGGLSVRLAHGPSTHEQLECIRQAPGAHFSVLFHPKGIQLAPCLLGNVNQMVTGLDPESLQKPLPDMNRNAHPAQLRHGTA